jgi:addiction module HigA family antidote
VAKSGASWYLSCEIKVPAMTRSFLHWDAPASKRLRLRTHPGEVLREEFMRPLGLSANALALALRVPATRIGAIIREREPRTVTADTALRLARYFGTTPRFWLNLQSAHDLSRAEAKRGTEIERDVRPRTV